jgi:hypothetical protein
LGVEEGLLGVEGLQQHVEEGLEIEEGHVQDLNL